MRQMPTILCLVLVLVLHLVAPAQVRPLPYFPDVEEYQTLVCDFHTHTVFSDGLVWPTVRVDEALREGLDVLCISDHIEYQPHKDDLPTNHNRPYALCRQRAKERNILLIRAAEITRDTPPGHYNAIFLNDIDPLETPGFFDCLAAAGEQDAFIFWNHHSWKGEDLGKWCETQTKMLSKSVLHGMEVANGGSYYPSAHKWCMEMKLTMLGNSDIHSPSINYTYTAQEHRTLTLVFASHRCPTCVRDALEKRRTAVWHKNMIVGREAVLKPLLAACVEVASPVWVKKDTLGFDVTNRALIDLEIERTGSYGPRKVTIPARSRYYMTTKINTQSDSTQMAFRVNNFLVAPGQGLTETLEIPHPASPSQH